MPQPHYDALNHVESVMNYLADEETNPAYYLYEPKPNFTPPPPAAKKSTVKIYDIRSIEHLLTLDLNGFELAQRELPRINFLNKESVKSSYYPECADLVMKSTGATNVIAFDYNVRDYDLAETDETIRKPVRFVHNDYTETSGPQRVKDLMGDQAQSLIARRYAFINVWRPLRGPVLDFPLAVIDARSLSVEDFVETDLKYADRTGKVYSVRNNPAHRWCYLNEMQEDEILLLKCFDSAMDGRSRYTAHASFRNPKTPENHLPRRSIETRTIAFF